MKKLFGVFASLALVFALVGCVMGQGAKGYKSAKEQIKASVVKSDEKAKIKWNGGNYVYVEAQKKSVNIIVASIPTEIPEGWYYEIKYTVTDSEGKTSDHTDYYYFNRFIFYSTLIARIA
ncbi:MAG: hypothetical protein K6F59_01105 [Gammaproteobacteria bacterium]|nr:hypothetical protein [Gammaproteobacteria bacterium]